MKALERHNPLLKEVARLDQARERRATGRFLVEGLRCLSAAERAGYPLEIVLVSPRHEEVGFRWEARGSQVYLVEEELLDRAAATSTCQGVLAIARMPTAPVVWHDLVLFLDRIADPGNLGTLVRAAAAVAPCTVVVGEEGADPFGPKAVRASAGALFSVPLTRLLEPLPEHAVFSAVVRGGQSVFQTCFPTRSLLVLGNEAHGLQELRGQAVTLPMAAGLESLNVAMAGTVMLYEMRRQMGFLPAG